MSVFSINLYIDNCIMHNTKRVIIQNFNTLFFFNHIVLLNYSNLAQFNFFLFNELVNHYKFFLTKAIQKMYSQNNSSSLENESMVTKSYKCIVGWKILKSNTPELFGLFYNPSIFFNPLKWCTYFNYYEKENNSLVTLGVKNTLMFEKFFCQKLSKSFFIVISKNV